MQVSTTGTADAAKTGAGQMDPRVSLFIGGEPTDGEAGVYAVSNPARPAEVVLNAPSASEAQLDAAVSAAKHALPQWSKMNPAERSELVCKAAEIAAAAAQAFDLARVLTREHGKVLWEAEFDSATIGGMAAAFTPLALEALETRELPPGGGRDTKVVKVPHGVVACVLPFNWPSSVLGNKVLPALLMGNTVVVKTPPTCPGSVLALAQALAEALPPGVVNTLNGPGRELGEALVSHRGVDMVSFTGGVPTGRAVMTGASGGITPVVLELGGNDPAIVAPDLEVDETVAQKIVDAAFTTSGQVCMAIKRLYVPEDKVPAVVEALVDRVSQHVVGDGLEPEVTMGPVHVRQAAERVESMIAEASELGARVHRPGTVREEDASSGGYFVSPAIVEGAPEHARIVREEQFAPALPVIGYRRIEDAVERANDSEYGLCASVWTSDEALASDLVERLEAGTVFVNAHGTSAMDHRAPFGGWKESGFGVELGVEGMSAFTRPKTVLRFQA
jgi:acyl-CoA reductase-like NAD-dependent aldehyde dehydrogenase